MANKDSNEQPDVIFSIVRIPERWTPENVFDVPPDGKILSRMPVASFDEAHDDLLRCNKIAIQFGLRQWAMIQTAGAEA